MSKIKQLLDQAKELDEQARQLRIQAGKMIHETTGPRVSIHQVREFGVSDVSFAAFLIEMYLTERGRQVRGEV